MSDIKDNKKRIYNINSNVSSNKTLILHLISQIQENRTMILNNYQSAFSVNTNLTTENTDEIYNNRELLFSNLLKSNNKNENKFI